MKAVIYYEKNELPAMMTVMESFAKFIQNTIIPYAPKLTEYDLNDRLLQKGVWESRADLLLDLRPLKEKLENANAFYLETEEVHGEQR